MSKRFISGLVIVILFLFGCSSKSENSSIAGSVAPESGQSMEESKMDLNDGEMMANNVASDNGMSTTSERMVVYTANLSIEVKHFQTAMMQIEEKTSLYGGYIVQSDVYENGENRYSGTVTVRVPKEKFQDFLNDAEGFAVKVHHRKVNGEDVTEQYVDLESRLKSKRIVEERLLEFMKTASRTEDLLKISSDLARAQEEIEQIIGRMNYLQNKSALATITINLSEDKIIVPSIESNHLNTWDRTKQQFVESLNYLLSFGSGIIVFFVGNIPIIIVLAIVVLITYFLVKRARLKWTSRDDE